MKCKIDACERDVTHYKSDQICNMHYHRRRRTGTFADPVRTKMERIVHSRGYIRVLAPSHPMVDARGYVWEHRMVYYNKDQNPTACAMCTDPITWETLHIDHIDENPSNNHPDNLRALCRPCNVFRGKGPLSQSKQHFEVNGVRMDAQAWSRMPGVKVSGNTIKRRRRAGMSDYDAIYSPRKTHQTMPVRKVARKYDKLRGLSI